MILCTENFPKMQRITTVAPQVEPKRMAAKSEVKIKCEKASAQMWLGRMKTYGPRLLRRFVKLDERGPGLECL